MRSVIVRFERDNYEDEDSAFQNFPHLIGDREAALLAQFRKELEQNERLRRNWRVSDHHYTLDKLWVWVKFNVHDDHPTPMLVDEIQRTYDEYGMDGTEFRVIDAQPRIEGDVIGEPTNQPVNHGKD